MVKKTGLKVGALSFPQQTLPEIEIGESPKKERQGSFIKQPAKYVKESATPKLVVEDTQKRELAGKEFKETEEKR